MRIIHFLVFFVVATTRLAFADAVSLELIFSEKYAGTLSCAEATSDSYCQSEVSTFSDTGLLLGKKSKLKYACFTGGGDCAAYVLFTEVKSLADGVTLARSKAQSGEVVWVKVEKLKIRELTPPVHERVVFRDDLKFIFLDKALTKKIPVGEAYAIPEGQAFNPKIEHLGVQQFFSGMVNGQKVIGLKLEAIESDTENEFTAPKENGYRRFIKEIYFPAIDSSGRINYWFITHYGC